MSKPRKSLDDYFKKPEVVVSIESNTLISNEQDKADENEQPEAKRSKFDDDNNSSITAATSIISISSHPRDPCHGPSTAKENVLLGPFQPKLNFPTVNNRHFCLDWYTLYKWLEYSEQLDRAYCFPCRFCYSHGKIDNAFTVHGFNNWRKGTEKLNSHQSYSSHKESFERYTLAVQNYNSNTDVLKLLDHSRSKQSEENRCYLREIVRTVHFLGRQGMACELFKKC